MDDTSTAVMDAPTTSATDAPAAPSSSAPTTEPTPTTDRPSLKDALDVFNEAAKQQGRKQRGNRPSPTATPSPTGSAPTVPEGTQAEPTSPQTRPGFVPTAAHVKAVENARTKTRTEVERELRDSYGGADPHQVREVMNWARRASTDRRGFMRDVLSEAMADPELSGWLAQSVAPRMTAQPTSAREPNGPPEPDFTDGQGHRFYSAEALQQRDQWLINQVKTEILGQVQPDLETIRAEREARQFQHEQQQRHAQIDSGIAEARKSWPYFDQFKADILAEAQKHPLTDGHPMSELAVLRKAYDTVVFPQLSKLEQARVVAELKKTAHASSLSPASTGAPTGIPKTARAKEGGSMRDALRWAMEQQAGA